MENEVTTVDDLKNDPSQTPPEAPAEAAEKPQSLWGDVWYSLKCNHFAMASLVIIGILVVIALVTAIAPGILPYDPYAQDLSQSFQAPSSAHWFGTDQLGRDILSRLIYGSRVSLAVVLAAVLLGEQISLDGAEFRVVMLQADADSIRATIERTDSPGEGRLALVFNEAPLRLHQWEVTDAQGIITAVVLEDPRFGVPLKRELFEFKDPRFFEEKLR